MQDFNDLNWLEEKIKSYFKRAMIEYTEDPREEANILHDYRVTLTDPNQVSVNIVIRNDINYLIEVVSIIKFSPIHVKALQSARPFELLKLKQEISVSMLTRDQDVILQFDEINNYEGAFYVISTPIYEGDLSFPVFMKSMAKTIKLAILVRQIIQDNLNILVPIEKSKMEISNE